MIRNLPLGLILATLLTGCAAPTVYMTEMRLRSLKANNLEETVSQRDELMIAYSLSAFDSKGQLVGVANHAWGVESVRKGAVIGFTSQPPVEIQLPKDGKVVASMVLIEVDDYQSAQGLIDRIRKVNGWVQVPASAGILLLGTEMLTPLKYVTTALAAAGLGVQLADRLDNDDLLGQSQVELKDADVRQKKQTYVRVPARFTGENVRDAFDYQLEYDVQLRQVKLKPGGQK